MKCSSNYSDEFFAKYIDGQLSTEEKIDFEKHLKICDKCFKTICDIIQYKSNILKEEFIDVPSEIILKIETLSTDKSKRSIYNVLFDFTKNNIEILKHSFKSLNHKPVLAFKGNENLPCAELFGEDFKFLIISKMNKFDLILSFFTQKDRTICFQTEEGKLLSITTTNEINVDFYELDKQNYKIYFADNEINISFRKK